MKIVVTIPAYNEETTIGTLINKINEVMSNGKYDYKIIVVDDGSKDKTAEVAKLAKDFADTGHTDEAMNIESSQWVEVISKLESKSLNCA